jgi:hypothetical protein
MAHWGWYWKIKREYTPKGLCQQSSLFVIDSFSMFKNSELVRLVRQNIDQISLKIPRYNLKAVLMPNDSLSVTYDGGSYVIPVEKRPCNYGGFYYFFRCPQCDARMRNLYCSDGKYLCRKCLKLGYYSQRLRPSQRSLVGGIDIKKQLANRGGTLTKKPIRMREHTFQVLRQRYMMHEKRYYDETNKELRSWYGVRVEPFLEDYYSAPLSV